MPQTVVVPSLGFSSQNLGTFAARPAAGRAGRLYALTDGPMSFFDDGVEWRPFIQPGLLGKAPPAAAGFTVRSASGIATTLVSEYDALVMAFSNSAGGASEVRVASRAQPSGNYRIEAHLRPIFCARGTMLVGIGFRSTATGAVEIFGIEVSSAFYKLARWRATASNTGTSPVYTFDTEVTTDWRSGANGTWLAITRNATSGDRTFEVSTDGYYWHAVATFKALANAFLTPAEVLLASWCSGGTNGDYQGTIFDSYEESAI